MNSYQRDKCSIKQAPSKRGMASLVYDFNPIENHTSADLVYMPISGQKLMMF